MRTITTTVDGQVVHQRQSPESFWEIVMSIAGYIPIWGSDFTSAPADGYFWWVSPMGHEYELEVTE